MDLKVIKNRAEYEVALERLLLLMDKNPPSNSKEENDLELLLLLIKDYEQRVIEPIEVDPVEAIKFRMDQMELTRKEMVSYLGSMSRVSEILSGKRDLSLSMIRKLHEGLGIPLESLILRKRSVRKRARKRKPLHKKSTLSRRRKRTFL